MDCLCDNPVWNKCALPRHQQSKPYTFFIWYDTLGVPFDIIFEIAREKNITLDWYDFWTNVLEKKWNPVSTFNMLSDSVRDVFGDDFYNEWLPRMKLTIMSFNMSLGELNVLSSSMG